MEKLELRQGEYVMEINDLNGNLAFGQLLDGDGNPLLAPDGICVATAALNLSHCKHEKDVGEGARFVVWLNPARPGSTFTYFASVVRRLSPAERQTEEAAM